MQKEDTQQFLNKLSTKIFLKSGRIYTGKIIKISETTISIIDKFNSNVIIDISSISEIRSDSNGGGQR